MSGSSERLQRRRAAVRTKLQRSAASQLKPEETIEVAALGMTSPIPTNQVEGLVNLGRLVLGRSRPVGVLMTNRAVHLARTGWARSRVIKLLASYPLEPRPPRVTFEETSAIRGLITVNDAAVYLPGGQFRSAQEIVRRVAGRRTD